MAFTVETPSPRPPPSSSGHDPRTAHGTMPRFRATPDEPYRPFPPPALSARPRAISRPRWLGSPMCNRMVL